MYKRDSSFLERKSDKGIFRYPGYHSDGTFNKGIAISFILG